MPKNIIKWLAFGFFFTAYRTRQFVLVRFDGDLSQNLL